MAVTPALSISGELASRPATVADVDAITQLVAACERFDDGVVEVDRDDIASDLAVPGLDPERDTMLVTDAGSVVAWAKVKRAGAFVDVDVHPSRRGRGIGTALMAWAEERARRAGGTFVRQSITDANEGAANLLRANGYAPRWTSWILEIELGDGLAEPAPPEGITIREFAPGLDEVAVHRLIEDAFVWEARGSMPFEDWAATTIRRDTFDPGLSPVAVDRDEVVGVALSLDYGSEAGGHVDQVAVAGPYRDRGIATALLHWAFAGFRRRGRDTCTLSTDSRTGALALYERVGMRIRRSYTAFVKEVGNRPDELRAPVRA